jgi:hypothetical protein
MTNGGQRKVRFFVGCDLLRWGTINFYVTDFAILNRAFPLAKSLKKLD